MIFHYQVNCMNSFHSIFHSIVWYY